MALRFPQPSAQPEPFIAQLLGLEAPEMDEFEPQQFQASPFEGFLERFAGGLGQMEAPRGFGESFLSGLAGSLAGQGRQVAQARQKFEAGQELRRREFAESAAKATADYRRERSDALKDLSKRQSEERKERQKFEREHPAVTEEMLAATPWLRRVYRAGDRLDPEVARLVKPEVFAPRQAERERMVSVVGEDGKAVYVPESQAAGRTPAGARENKPPSAGEREQLTTDADLLKQVGNIRASFQRRFTGPVGGRVGGAKRAVGLSPKEESAFRGRVAALRNQVLKARSGGAVTEGEAQRLLEEMPIPNDPDFLVKLDTFENLVRNIAEARREIMSGTGVDLSRIPALPVASAADQPDAQVAARRGSAASRVPTASGVRAVRGPDGKLVKAR
jgi:hypothetical protein